MLFKPVRGHLSLPLSLLPCNEVVLLWHELVAITYCLVTGSKVTGPNDHRSEPPKLGAQSTISGYKLLASDSGLWLNVGDVDADHNSKKQTWHCTASVNLTTRTQTNS